MHVHATWRLVIRDCDACSCHVLQVHHKEVKQRNSRILYIWNKYTGIPWTLGFPDYNDWLGKWWRSLRPLNATAHGSVGQNSRPGHYKPWIVSHSQQNFQSLKAKNSTVKDYHVIITIANTNHDLSLEPAESLLTVASGQAPRSPLWCFKQCSVLGTISSCVFAHTRWYPCGQLNIDWLINSKTLWLH